MADWTVNNPIKVKHDIVPARQGAPLDLRVFVRFQDDATPTTNKFPDESQEAKIYTARGAGAWDAVRESVRQDRLTLQEGELPPADGATFTPATAPSPKEQAILDVQEALRRYQKLSDIRDRLGKAGTDNIGGTTVTYDTRLGTYETVIDNNVTTAPHINNRLVDEF